MAQHPLSQFVAEISPPIEDFYLASELSGYDPNTQMSLSWEEISDHLELLCSSKRTGDPNTGSYTTNLRPTEADYDTDDSGT